MSNEQKLQMQTQKLRAALVLGSLIGMADEVIGVTYSRAVISSISKLLIRETLRTLEQAQQDNESPSHVHAHAH